MLHYFFVLLGVASWLALLPLLLRALDFDEDLSFFSWFFSFRGLPELVFLLVDSASDFELNSSLGALSCKTCI